MTNVPPENFTTQESLDRRVDAVVNELQHAGTQSDSGSSKLGLLIGSAVLFVILGAWFWSIEIVLYLLPVLLFHELGHYVAMRVFKYRNVKMFFLPLLGAAVSGQHLNVAGWKKVVVSLAGPIPGILLAIPMAIIAIQTENELWRNATAMVVLINAFNLLPLLPLDGGWVAHALYFCRQPWLDVLFRLTAAIAMIAIGVTWQMFFFTAFGALMLLAIPAAVKNSNVAKAVRRSAIENLPATSADGRGSKLFPGEFHSANRLESDALGKNLEIVTETNAAGEAPALSQIPRPIVETIVSHLPTTGPASLPKPLAQQTRQIYDVLNARPPGIAATIGLTLLYLAGWVISIAVIAALFFGLQWQRSWNEAPAVSVARGARVQVDFSEQQPVDDHAPRYLVLGTSDEPAFVDVCTAELKQQGDCQFAFASIGDSVLVSIDVDEAESKAGRAMIQSFKNHVESHHWFDSSEGFYFQVECVAPAEQQANTLVDQANEMLMFGNDLALVEPWSPDHSISQAQITRRQTRRVLDAPFDAANDPVLEELSEAASQIDLESKEALQQQLDRYDRIHEQRYEAAVEQIKADETGRYDQDVLQHWDRRPGRFLDEQANTRANTMEEQSWRLKLADLLGRIPGTVPFGIDPDDDQNDDPQSPQQFKYSITGGMASAEDRKIQIRFLRFRNPITGLPAMLQWLQANGCEDLQFQILENIDLSQLP